MRAKSPAAIRIVTPLLAVALLASVLTFGCGAATRDNSDAMRPGTLDQQAEALAALGVSLSQQGDLAGALSELSRADALKPGDPQILNFLGLTYYKLQDYPKSAEHFERALSIDPTKTEIHNNLGLVYLDQRRYDLATIEFETCLADPTYPNSHLPQYNLGVIAELQGRVSDAEAIYLRLVTLRPLYDLSYYRLARISFDRGEFRRAADYLTAAVRINRDNPDSYFLLGECYERLGDPDQAADAYGQVVNIVPNTTMAMEAQSRVRKVLGFE